MQSSSLWRTDTIVVFKLNKPPVSIKPPPPSNGLEINKPPGGLNRGFTVIHSLVPNRAIFNLVLKVIWDCIGFALLGSVSGLENSRHLLSQSDTKLKPIATWLLAFSALKVGYMRLLRFLIGFL